MDEITLVQYGDWDDVDVREAGTWSTDAPAARSAPAQEPVAPVAPANYQSGSSFPSTVPDTLIRSPLSLERDFQQGEVIGAGSFGRVICARHRGSGLIVAVKEMVMETRGEDHERLLRELRILEQLRHERVVRYFGYEITLSSVGDVQRLFIFLEYCSGGSVASRLRLNGPMPEHGARRYGRQLLEGLCYLHSREPPVVHRDLKCANLLLTHDERIKIADFGSSKWLREGGVEKGKHTMVGSVFWAAPEVLCGGAELTIAVDYWSFGCCLLEMVTGKHPWAEQEFTNFFHACRQIAFSEQLPLVPEHLSQDIRAVIRPCLRRDPADRADANHLLELPFFSAA